jgi:drug/metabolite transporter (DMT)-like permease
MSPFVMIAVLFAALLHASWNFMVKRTDDKHRSMGAVVLGHLPFAIAVLFFAPIPRTGSIPYIITGIFLHTGYQLFLLNSYRIGDLSQVYPLARGIAPLIVAVISALFLAVDLSWFELSAIAMIGTGIISLALTRRSDGLRNGRAAVMAAITGGFIAAYSLIDGMGAREAGTALGFFGWLSIGNTLIFAVIMRITRPGLIKNIILRDWRLAVLGGGSSYTAYALIIWAFTLAPIALVTALRETSIIFALFLGVFVLKERLDLVKMFATLLTMIGVGLLRVSR